MLEKLRQLLDIPYALSCFRFGDWSDKTKPVLVLIHGIGVNHKIWRGLIKKLPDTPILAVDLLGFGSSKKPKLAQYNIRDHAQALKKTLRKAVGNRRLILCGHSLGSLVSIDFAKRYPKNIDQLILCAPPIYDMKKKGNFPSHEAILEQIGRRFLNAIEASSGRRIAAANAYSVHQKKFRIDPKNTSPYIKTARNSIMNQAAMTDIANLKMPIHIVYGSLDTVMIPANFKRVRKDNSRIAIKSVVAGHELNATYETALVKLISPGAVKSRTILPGLKK